MPYKPVGVETTTSLFPPRVMAALRAIFATSTPADGSVGTAQLADRGVTSVKVATSVALAGSPTTTTPAAADSSTRIANTEWVRQVVAAFVDSAPAQLDTLKEFATALGNDANFSATIMALIALRAPLASPVLTGDPKAPTPPTADRDTSIATTAFVRAAMETYGQAASTTVWITFDTVTKTWPARPNAPVVGWICTNDITAGRPADMREDTDMIIAHPNSPLYS